jgi:hypothetical protein
MTCCTAAGRSPPLAAWRLDHAKPCLIEPLHNFVARAGRPRPRGSWIALPRVLVGWDDAMAKNDDHPAKQAVIKEWDDWASKHGEDVVGDGMLFFGYLQRERPDLLLDFKHPGDKWQIVYTWLLREGRVGR